MENLWIWATTLASKNSQGKISFAKLKQEAQSYGMKDELVRLATELQFGTRLTQQQLIQLKDRSEDVTQLEDALKFEYHKG